MPTMYMQYGLILPLKMQWKLILLIVQVTTVAALIMKQVDGLIGVDGSIRTNRTTSYSNGVISDSSVGIGVSDRATSSDGSNEQFLDGIYTIIGKIGRIRVENECTLSYAWLKPPPGSFSIDVFAHRSACERVDFSESIEIQTDTLRRFRRAVALIGESTSQVRSAKLTGVLINMSSLDELLRASAASDSSSLSQSPPVLGNISRTFILDDRVQNMYLRMTYTPSGQSGILTNSRVNLVDPKKNQVITLKDILCYNRYCPTTNEVEFNEVELSRSNLTAINENLLAIAGMGSEVGLYSANTTRDDLALELARSKSSYRELYSQVVIYRVSLALSGCLTGVFGILTLFFCVRLRRCNKGLPYMYNKAMTIPLNGNLPSGASLLTPSPHTAGFEDPNGDSSNYYHINGKLTSQLENQHHMNHTLPHHAHAHQHNTLGTLTGMMHSTNGGTGQGPSGSLLHSPGIIGASNMVPNSGSTMHLFGDVSSIGGQPGSAIPLTNTTLGIQTPLSATHSPQHHYVTTSTAHLHHHHHHGNNNNNNGGGINCSNKNGMTSDAVSLHNAMMSASNLSVCDNGTGLNPGLNNSLVHGNSALALAGPTYITGNGFTAGLNLQNHYYSQMTANNQNANYTTLPASASNISETSYNFENGPNAGAGMLTLVPISASAVAMVAASNAARAQILHPQPPRNLFICQTNGSNVALSAGLTSNSPAPSQSSGQLDGMSAGGYLLSGQNAMNPMFGVGPTHGLSITGAFAAVNSNQVSSAITTSTMTSPVSTSTTNNAAITGFVNGMTVFGAGQQGLMTNSNGTGQTQPPCYNRTSSLGRQGSMASLIGSNNCLSEATKRKQQPTANLGQQTQLNGNQQSYIFQKQLSPSSVSGPQTPVIPLSMLPTNQIAVGLSGNQQHLIVGGQSSGFLSTSPSLAGNWTTNIGGVTLAANHLVGMGGTVLTANTGLLELGDIMKSVKFNKFLDQSSASTNGSGTPTNQLMSNYINNKNSNKTNESNDGAELLGEVSLNQIQLNQMDIYQPNNTVNQPTMSSQSSCGLPPLAVVSRYSE